MKLLKAILLTLAMVSMSAAFASEKYDIVKQDYQANLGTFRQIQDVDNDVDLYAVTLNDNYRGKIFRQKADSLSSADSIGALRRTESFLLAINGGYYTPDFTPVGLYIEKGKTISRLSRQSILNSCVRVDDNKIFLETDSANCLSANSAIQAGPALIKQGDIADNLPMLQKRSPKLEVFFEPHRRTVLAMSADKKLIVIVSSPITLMDMAKLLKTAPQLFGVKKIMTAVNLDGGASTGMYIRLDGNPFYFSEVRPVKTLLFFN